MPLTPRNLVGSDLAPLNAPGIIRRWNKTGKPVPENPCASPLFKSAAPISDVPTWIQAKDPSHLGETGVIGETEKHRIGVRLAICDSPGTRQDVYATSENRTNRRPDPPFLKVRPRGASGTGVPPASALPGFQR